MPRLVLFDIDGTLLTDGGAAREAFGIALREIYRYEGDLARYDFSGRTDPEIASMILRDGGWEQRDIDSRLPDLWQHYLGGLEQRARAPRVRALPGMQTLLDELSAKPDVVMALLTGNLERGARLKLAPPDFNRYFSFGAYGSDSSRRADLPPIAAGRAGQTVGIHFAGRDIVIIGDSIHDVRCGVPHDATTIAIASGKTSAERLRAENPSYFFDSAENTDELIHAITG